MNWKEHAKKKAWHNLSYHIGIYLEQLKKTTKFFYIAHPVHDYYSDTILFQLTHSALVAKVLYLKTTKISHVSLSPGRELKPGPLEQDAYTPATRL
jgi:hypothetical protein